MVNDMTDISALIERVKAKPLEWYEPSEHPQDLDDSAILVAHGIGGRYSISHRQLIDRKTGAQGYLLWLAHDNFVFERCTSIESAKVKAEADWQQRYALLLALKDN